MTKLKICLAGATGWAGSALARGIIASPDLELVAAVSRGHAGKTLGTALGVEGLSAPVFATASEAMGVKPEIFVEYTKPGVAKANVLAALRGGAHVVVATSGLTEADYEEIDGAARAAKRGALAVGNFAITAVLLQKFAELTAKYIPHWEITDYAPAGKIDAPSGTSRELADRLAKVRAPLLEVPLDQVSGERASRGATLQGTQVHSVRLPGFVSSIEVIFGAPDHRLTLRHDSGASAEPYVNGALLAIRKVGGLIGLHRGLDKVMEQ